MGWIIWDPMGKNLSHSLSYFRGLLHGLGSKIALSFHPSWLQIWGSHSSFLYSTVLLEWSIDLRQVLCLLYPFVIKDTTESSLMEDTQGSVQGQKQSQCTFSRHAILQVLNLKAPVLLFGEFLMAPLNRHGRVIIVHWWLIELVAFLPFPVRE